MALTNLQAINGYFNFKVPENLIEKCMIDRDVNGEDTYTKDQTANVELTVADICFQLVNVTSEAEGGLTIVYDKKQLKDLRVQLLKKHGETDSDYGIPTINKGNVW